MQNLEIVEWWIVHFKLNFPKIIWWWQFGCEDRLMLDSSTKLGWHVKVRSIHEEKVPDIWVGLLIIWWNPNWKKRVSNIFHSKLFLSKPYQFFDFALKSLRTASRYRLFWTARSRFNSRLSVNLSNSSCVLTGRSVETNETT